MQVCFWTTVTPIAFKTSLSARPCFYDHSPVPVPCEMLPSRPHTLHKVPQTCAAPLCFGKLLLQPGLLFPPLPGLHTAP